MRTNTIFSSGLPDVNRIGKHHEEEGEHTHEGFKGHLANLNYVAVIHAPDLTQSGERFQNLLYARRAGANETAGDFVHAKYLVAAQGILDELHLLGEN